MGGLAMKSIFITGSSSGIGKETAVLFADRGWFVGITDVDIAGLDKLKKQMNGKIVFSAAMNVTDSKSVAGVLNDFVRAAGGKIDILFNSAGILRINPFEDISLADHHAIIDINNKGLLNCVYHAFPHLKNNPGSQIINMSSVASIMPTPCEATYSASKHWVRGLTEALNIEWARYGIHVCDVMPTNVDTAMIRSNPGTLVNNVGVYITAKQVADTVWKAARRKRVHWVVDRSLFKMYFKIKGILPFAVDRIIMKKMAGV
jgi:NADP-dependent 3-hydroxy acid dehydrogenase YdfG